MVEICDSIKELFLNPLSVVVPSNAVQLSSASLYRYHRMVRESIGIARIEQVAPESLDLAKLAREL
jgi:hypothetical protein